jgi:hypothetical protein
MRYLVLTDYARQYADPISFEQGEAIQRERSDDQNPTWWWCTDKRGKSGWVHESYFEYEDYRYIALENYSALELTVKAGDVLDGLDVRGGWALCANANGDIGWVPLDNVQPMA